MVYPKYVKINSDDIVFAIQQGIPPMLTWVDPDRNNLPYFENRMTGDEYGNRLHQSYSAAHMPGRQLESLTVAEKYLDEAIPENVYNNLRYWALKVFDNPMNVMCDIDLKTLVSLPIVDLHNLRESMYSFVGLLRRNPDDIDALAGANTIIDLVDRYTDFEKGEWKKSLFEKEKQGTSMCSVTDLYDGGFRLAGSVGRYIQALMRLYAVKPLPQVLSQAVRLTNTFFENVLFENGEFDKLRFGAHIHSTTATICGIAMLGDFLSDDTILNRIDAFFNNGVNDIALDFGWCIEGGNNTEFFGEINNSVDLMEACLYLGKNGYSGYYSRAEKMIRSHILPSQLLDVSFISDEVSSDNSIDRMASRSKGAFGGPCPYGHECMPGSVMGFNWDIVAGGVSGLSHALDHIVYEYDNFVSINMLFDYRGELIDFFDPYKNGTAIIKIKKDINLRLRLPELTNQEKIKQLLINENINFIINGEWVYLLDLNAGDTININLYFEQKIKSYKFRTHNFTAKFSGEKIVAAESKGKRLCFFEEL